MPLAGSASHSTWPPPASSPLVPLSGWLASARAGWLASARADRSGEESAGCAVSGAASGGGGRGSSGGLPPASRLARLALPEDEQAARSSVVASQVLRRGALGIVLVRASARLLFIA